MNGNSGAADEEEIETPEETEADLADDGEGLPSEEGEEDRDGDEESGEGSGEGKYSRDGSSNAQARSGSGRVQEAIRRAEAATERAEAAERRLRESDNTRNAQLSAQERQAKLEAMSPEDRMNFIANEAMARVDFETRKAQFASQDLADKAEFLNKISTKPHLANLIPQVESKLADLRKQGQNVTREVMLKFVLGERAYAAALKGGSLKQRKQGAENIKRATTISTNGRGTVNGSARRSGDTAASRLAGITF